ncbi:MAG TPA: oligosaccharide flippase family protein [Actinomycetota bacterium]|nr:oligosaccharide flippase family protein [Actinomycetota bacterium]
MSTSDPSQGSGLRALVLRGGTVLAAGTMVERLARLGRNMLLARVIAPDQFGIMAIVLAVLALFEALTEVGIAQAVIQNKRGGSPEFLNLAWWSSALRGVTIVAVGVPLAPLIADFYEQPSLTPLLRVAMVSMVFIGATSPRIYALQREFRFGATLWTTQGAGLLGTAITLALGFYLQNVWALVLGTVIESFARFAISFILCPIRPSLRFDPEARAELFSFARGMAGLPIMTFVLMQADTFVLAKVASTELLGLYSMAIVLAGFPLTVFSKVAQPMAVPILANFQDDFNGLRSAFLRISRLVWLFGLPMAVYLAAFAKPILEVVYGADYARVSGAFGVYSFYTVVYMASMVSFSVYLAIARPGLQRGFTLARAVLVAASMYPAVLWLGPLGAASSLLASLALSMVLQVAKLKRVIGLPVLAYLHAMAPGLMAASAVAAAALPIATLLTTPPLVTGFVGATPLLASWAASVYFERRDLHMLQAERTKPSST